jgi:hypothetical protein
VLGAGVALAAKNSADQKAAALKATPQPFPTLYVGDTVPDLTSLLNTGVKGLPIGAPLDTNTRATSDIRIVGPVIYKPPTQPAPAAAAAAGSAPGGSGGGTGSGGGGLLPPQGGRGFSFL